MYVYCKKVHFFRMAIMSISLTKKILFIYFVTIDPMTIPLLSLIVPPKWAIHCSNKKGVCPKDQTICHDKVICKSFLKQTLELFINLLSYLPRQVYPGKKIIKLCWHK